MAISLTPLASGSRGNATLIEGGGTYVLVDAGLSCKRLVDLMGQINVLPEMLKGVLITHEHSDHIAGLAVLAKKYRLPVFASEGTWQRMGKKAGDLPPHQQRIVRGGEDFYIGDLAVSPMDIAHDAKEPLCYRVFQGAHSVAVATDMGHVTAKVKRHLAGTDLMILESNHDPDMLLHNPVYPEALKQRILGKRGHLCNDDCAVAVMEFLEKGLKQVLLGHLSAENNTPELALSVTRQALRASGVVLGRDIQVDVARQDKAGATYTVL